MADKKYVKELLSDESIAEHFPKSKAAKTKRKKMSEVATPVVIDKAMVLRVAAAAASGHTKKLIAQETGIPVRKVEQILERSDCKLEIDRIGEDSVRSAKSLLRRRVAVLAPKMLEALEHLISKKRDVRALALAFKVMGVDSGEEEKGGTNISVVIPGAAPKAPSIPAEGRTVGDDTDE